MPSAKTLAAAVGYAALAATDSYLAGRPGTPARRLRYAVKPLLMPTLARAFASGTAGRTDLLRRGTLAAQALSWGGDMALLGRGERAFLAGVGSFAAAHAAYIAGFGSAHADRSELSSAGPKSAAAMWATTAPLMALAARRRSPELGVPILGYGTILASMYATSTVLDPAIPRRARRTIRAGTALFLASDTLLGVQQFLLRERRPALEAAVMGTYTAGQGLIALGVAGAGGRREGP